VHAKLRLGNRDQLRSRRGVANLCLEPHTLVAQLPEASFDDAHLSSLIIAVAAPRYHSRGGDHEPDKKAEDYPAAANSYAALRHALSLALLARGLRSISAAEVLIAFRFTSEPNARPPQVH
jgi:hypothetical protein